MTRKVSVLMSTYHKDDPSLLQDALISLAKQDHLPDEIVLVLDGPVPKKTIEVAQGCAGFFEEFKIIPLEKNQGLARALNIGLSHCSHELVARMDADDICLPNRISDNLSMIERYPLCGIVGGDYDIYDPTMTMITGARKVPTDPVSAQSYSSFRVPFNHPTIMFRKSLVESVGGYPTDIGRLEDWGFALKCLSNGIGIANSGNTLLKFRGGAELIARRSGLRYFKEEYTALRALRSAGYLSYTHFVLNFLVRLPLRLLPRGAIAKIYRAFMHNK